MNRRSQEIATQSTKAIYRRKQLGTTRRLTYLATLVALALIFKILGQMLQTDSFKLTLVYIPWFVAAICFGPIGGATVAFATDLLGTFILPTGGAPNPILTLAYAMMGVIMGLVFKLPRLSDKLKLLIGTLIVIPVCTFGIWSIGMGVYYGKAFLLAKLALRPVQIPIIAINAAATAFLFPALYKLGLMPTQKAKAKA